jgi:hypothetical protein
MIKKSIGKIKYKENPYIRPIRANTETTIIGKSWEIKRKATIKLYVNHFIIYI